jgi:hypothetical protein
VRCQIDVRAHRAAGIALVAILLTSGCGQSGRPAVRHVAATRPQSSSSLITGTPQATVGSAMPPLPLVPWRGPVEELFVHPLVINPALAFRSDQLGIGFQDYFVTALEFGRILDQLWANGWTLVDIHRAAAGTVRVPQGRRPLVLSEDDVNYYRYFDGRGLAARLVLDGDRVRAELPGGALTDDEVVPLVEAEVARHPEFSADGAKGVLAVTGYEGLFGEHQPGRAAARSRLIALAQWLHRHGWTIASHTWGHIDLSASSPTAISWDVGQWKALAEPLLGRTDVLIYPFGARPDDAALRQLVAAGFRIQIDIDILARTRHYEGAVIMSRRHVDGCAFEVPQAQAQFYDVATVRDPARPPSPGC